MKIKVIAFIVLFTSAVGFRFQQGGESSGGGGSSSAGEFQMIASWTLNSLSQRGEVQIKNRVIDLSAMSVSLVKVQLQPTTEKLFLNGTPVSAINYPEQKRIVFNEDNWKALDRLAKMQLCLHEIWGLTFADHQDDNYIYSSAMVELVSAFSFENSSQIISAQSTDMDLEGQSFRAMVIKTNVHDQYSYQIIFEKITELTTGSSIITSHVVYDVSELPVKAKWGLQNLRLGRQGFEFELNYFLPEQVTCLYPLPPIPLTGIELEKATINCHPSTPGQIRPYKGAPFKSGENSSLITTSHFDSIQ